ncbi:MAG: hypothetical protein J5511_04750 [Bacilli bacterium]|nr:hypothetical protein [Bacilli bacterium]
MAIRRCFSKKIVRSDDFIDLPATTQLLYFQLGMEADDRGYINNARSVIKLVGCSKGDLEMLIAKRFVLVRKDTLILIKGWRINNTIQPTRRSETLYVDDLKLLYLDEHGSYTEKETSEPVLLTTCRQNDDNLLTEDNIREEKITKDNLIESNPIQRNETGIFKWIEASDAAKILFLNIPTSFDGGVTSPNKDRYCFYFDSLLKEGINERDIKDALEDIFTDLDEDDIDDKYLYLTSRLNKILRLNSDGFEDDNLATTEVVNNNSLDEEEVSDDDLPF